MLAEAESLWQKRWRAQMQDMAKRSDTSYWNRRANDYNDFINNSGYDYGKQMAKVLEAEEILNEDSSVLEIASGVGAVTLPLAAESKRVIALEPAGNMAELLSENAQKNNIENLEIVVQDFGTFAARASDNSFDLVFLCHAAWQFPDLPWLLSQMSRLSSAHCCLADTLGSEDSEHKEIRHKLGLVTPDLDRTLYLYNVLFELGLPANISYIPHLMRRSVGSATSMWKNLVGKYRTLSDNDAAIIQDHVLSRTRDGIYESPGTMSLIWWRSK